MFIITLLFPLLIIIFLAFLIVKMSGRGIGRRLFYGEKLKSVIVSYVMIMLLSTLLFPILYQAQIKGKEESSRETLEIVTENRVYTLENAVLRSEEQFEVSDETLTITSQHGEYLPDVTMIIDRHSSNIVEVQYYHEQAIAMEHVPPYSFAKVGHELIIAGDYDVSVNFATFDHEFTITQFTGEDDVFGFSSNRVWNLLGEQLIYIRVPEHIRSQVDDSFHIVDYTKD